PLHIVALGGLAEIVGEAFTVSVAAVVGMLLPHRFENRARYWLLVCAATVAKLSVAFVAPEISANVDPPCMLTCHCTVGAGLPVAEAENDALDPSHFVSLDGLLEIVGAVFTVNVAAAVATLLPHVFENLAR